MLKLETIKKNRKQYKNISKTKLGTNPAKLKLCTFLQLPKGIKIKNIKYLHDRIVITNEVLYKYYDEWDKRTHQVVHQL